MLRGKKGLTVTLTLWENATQPYTGYCQLITLLNHGRGTLRQVASQIADLTEPKAHSR